MPLEQGDDGALFGDVGTVQRVSDGLGRPARPSSSEPSE
jgi:hypothetical protein